LTSILWHIPDVSDIIDLDFVSRCDLDLCEFGLKSPKGVQPEVRYKKPTRIIGIFEHPEALEKRCTKTHDHGSLARQEYFVLAGGVRLLKSRHAGSYTAQFSRALLSAI
jgi:hypothetical protein